MKLLRAIADFVTACAGFLGMGHATVFSTVLSTTIILMHSGHWFLAVMGVQSLAMVVFSASQRRMHERVKRLEDRPGLFLDFLGAARPSPKGPPASSDRH